MLLGYSGVGVGAEEVERAFRCFGISALSPQISTYVIKNRMGKRRFVVVALALAACAAQLSDEEAAAAAASAATDVEPINFELAWEMAKKSRQQGSSIDEAVEVADRVLGGEAPFRPLKSPTGSGSQWLYAQEWLSESDAQLLQHEVISTPGWPKVGALDSPRELHLSSPLPPWAKDLAERLAPALGNAQPDLCDVHACEPGQRTEPLTLGDGSVALVTLGSSAALLTAHGEDAADPERYPFPSPSTRPLDARSVLLPEAASSGAWGHCVHSGGRCLSLVFRCSSKAS